MEKDVSSKIEIDTEGCGCCGCMAVMVVLALIGAAAVITAIVRYAIG